MTTKVAEMESRALKPDPTSAPASNTVGVWNICLTPPIEVREHRATNSEASALAASNEFLSLTISIVAGTTLCPKLADAGPKCIAA